MVYLSHNRMCSNQDLTIPLIQGRPQGEVLEDATPLKEWMLDYSFPY